MYDRDDNDGSVDIVTNCLGVKRRKLQVSCFVWLNLAILFSQTARFDSSELLMRRPRLVASQCATFQPSLCVLAVGACWTLGVLSPLQPCT